MDSKVSPRAIDSRHTGAIAPTLRTPDTLLDEQRDPLVGSRRSWLARRMIMRLDPRNVSPPAVLKGDFGAVPAVVVLAEDFLRRPAEGGSDLAIAQSTKRHECRFGRGGERAAVVIAGERAAARNAADRDG